MDRNGIGKFTLLRMIAKKHWPFRSTSRFCSSNRRFFGKDKTVLDVVLELIFLAQGLNLFLNSENRRQSRRDCLETNRRKSRDTWRTRVAKRPPNKKISKIQSGKITKQVFASQRARKQTRLDLLLVTYICPQPSELECCMSLWLKQERSLISNFS